MESLLPQHANNTNQVIASEKFIPLLCAYFDTQFPKGCSSCGESFTRLADYRRYCTPLNEIQLFEMPGDDSSQDHVHMMSMVNCRCGTTLSLSSPDRHGGSVYQHFLEVCRSDAEALGWSLMQVFAHLQSKLWLSLNEHSSLKS